jgi:hypothetical protein
VARFGFRFGRYGLPGADRQWSDRHQLAEVVRVSIDDAATFVDALVPHGIVATALPPAEPDADPLTAAIVVLAGELDRAEYVLRQAGYLPDR